MLVEAGSGNNRPARELISIRYEKKAGRKRNEGKHEALQALRDIFASLLYVSFHSCFLFSSATPPFPKAIRSLPDQTKQKNTKNPQDHLMNVLGDGKGYCLYLVFLPRSSQFIYLTSTAKLVSWLFLLLFFHFLLSSF